MDKMLIVNVILIVLFVGVLAVLWYKGKKELVKKVLLGLVIQAEDRYMNGENEAKTDAVLKVIVAFVNRFWIFRLFVTEKALKNWIKWAVDYMQAHLGTTTEREEAMKKLALEFATNKVTELADNVTRADVGGNVNLADNDTVLHLKDNLLDKIEKDYNGFVTAKLDTGFTKKSTKTTIEAGYKF